MESLAVGNFPEMAKTGIDPTTGGNFEGRDHGGETAGSSKSTSIRMIIVVNLLPLKAEKRDGRTWSFSWDEDSLLFQLKDGFLREMLVFYVGCLKVDIQVNERRKVSQTLRKEFNCVPTFLPPEILEPFYHGFCKRHLWPLFHYMLPFSFKRLESPLWDAYVSANRLFSRRVMEVFNPEKDYVWIHDYHLMMLPSLLRRAFVRMKMGFFLHTPFPSSEIYRTLSVREVILKSLLNCDVIGFHTYDYARHFLSSCSRILGLKHKLDKGFIELEYCGRTIRIKIMPVGIHMGRIESVMRGVEGNSKVKNIIEEHLAGKTLLLGIDDIDIFKGTELKLLAMECMLKRYPQERGKAVLIQIMNPARGKGIYYDEILDKVRETCDRINEIYEQPGYRPIVLLEGPACTIDKFAYYSMAECLVVTPLRDGMNLSPYEYIACRQEISGHESSSSSHKSKKSMLVISEFMGCSSSLSGALRANPWNVEEVAMKMYEAISMNDLLKQSRHTNHYKYIRNHDVVRWSASFFEDMEITWANQSWSRCRGVGSGLDFRVVLEPNCGKLPLGPMISDYKRTKTRAILLDCDGTLIPLDSLDKYPSAPTISTLNNLCADKRNVVFIVSGRRRESLSEWFKSCKNLGIAAEHGFFLRWPGNEEWETFGRIFNKRWMGLAEPTMELYTAATDGSYIERKEHALVWNYQNADSGFGSSQAKELLDHLVHVFANDPVTVKSGKFIVEVKSQGVDKGTAAKTILKSMAKKKAKAEFILCIGDDKSDEDMFEILNATVKSNVSSPNPVFTCTINQKPTKAKYYLEDITDVMTALEHLASASSSLPTPK